MHKRREQTQSRCVVTWPHLSLTPSLEKWQQRQRMLRLWTEGKNSKPKSWGSVRVRPAGELQPQTCRTPAGQSEARIGPSPANQRPGSGPLPVAFGLSAVWGQGGRRISRDPYLPPELWKQHGYCVLSDPLKSNRSNGHPESIICDQINVE